MNSASRADGHCELGVMLNLLKGEKKKKEAENEDLHPMLLMETTAAELSWIFFFFF